MKYEQRMNSALQYYERVNSNNASFVAMAFFNLAVAFLLLASDFLEEYKTHNKVNEQK
jgi:hypothetical protein